VLGTLAGVFFGAMQLEAVNYEVNKQLWRVMPVREPPESVLVSLRYLGVLDEKAYLEKMKSLGYNENNAKLIYQSYIKKLDASRYIFLYFRKEISEDELKKHLSSLGYGDKDIEYLIKTSKYYPSVSDIIRFSVRDVYSPETIKKYGMDMELPEKYLEEAELMGLDRENAIKYWRAHWTLPSASLGAEMLYRLNRFHDKEYLSKYVELGLDPSKLEFNVEDYKDLIRRLDIEPYYRDRIVATLFNPLTRVDLRRLYEAGLIDEKYVYNVYLDLGYAPKDAELLTKFAWWLKYEDTRKLSLSYIKKLYANGQFDSETAKKYLVEYGYSESDAELLISLWDIENTYNELEERVNLLVTRYLIGELSLEQLQAELDKLNVSSQYRDKVLSYALNKIKSKRRYFSPETYAKMYKKKLITRDQFKQILISLGYSETDSENYIKLYS